jgi:hypothetical protein
VGLWWVYHPPPAGAIAPDFVAGAMVGLSPPICGGYRPRLCSFAPDFVAGAMVGLSPPISFAPDFVAGAIAPDFVRSPPYFVEKTLLVLVGAPHFVRSPPPLCSFVVGETLSNISGQRESNPYLLLGRQIIYR